MGASGLKSRGVVAQPRLRLITCRKIYFPAHRPPSASPPSTFAHLLLILLCGLIEIVKAKAGLYLLLISSDRPVSLLVRQFENIRIHICSIVSEPCGLCILFTAYNSGLSVRFSRNQPANIGDTQQPSHSLTSESNQAHLHQRSQRSTTSASSGELFFPLPSPSQSRS